MSIEIKAPQFPESVPNGTIAAWHKQVGEPVKRDELLVDIETDKVVLEVVAPADGVLTQIIKQAGDVVASHELMAQFAAGVAASVSVSEVQKSSSAAAAKVTVESVVKGAPQAGPAARKLARENDVDAATIEGTGPGGRVTKTDVISKAAAQNSSVKTVVAPSTEPVAYAGARPEKRVPMTRLRARIAERLLMSTQTTAMLTTFNEVNMQPVMQLREKYKAQFEKAHGGTRLGFMSFFVKAAVEALKRFPAVNASLDGSDVVYHGYQDIGVAVSTEKGLVVPILKDADTLSLADIENRIRDFALRAKENKLSIDDITGGTFTITNGGTFGSLLSTPILNPPQTAILGMHKIQDRPMAVDGQVRILPMMYLALSYDHRLIDGKDAVQFLVTIKDMVEDPARILLEV